MIVEIDLSGGSNFDNLVGGGGCVKCLVVWYCVLWFKVGEYLVRKRLVSLCY